MHSRVFTWHAIQVGVYICGTPCFVIFISDPPTVHQHPQNVSTDSGYPSTFTCSASGFPRPSITWYTQNGSEIHPLPENLNEVTVNFTGAEGITSRLVVVITVFADSGDYVCVASNPVGSSTSDPALLEVIGMLIIKCL